MQTPAPNLRGAFRALGLLSLDITVKLGCRTKCRRAVAGEDDLSPNAEWPPVKEVKS